MANESGYALPIVLVAILVFAIFAGEMALRISREARVTKVQENSARAFYLAEAGFNRVRAALINGQKKVGNTNICSTGSSPVQTISGTLTASDGTVIGTYSVDVTCNDPNYSIVANGDSGTGWAAGHRVVSGTVTVGALKTISGTQVYAVTTAYNQ